MELLKEIKGKLHGVVSLGLLGIAIIIGFLGILVENVEMASLYLIFVFISPFPVCYFFCLKCPVRSINCAHVFPGKLTKIFKPKGSRKYTFTDYFITFFVLIILIALPQFWLFQRPLMLTSFWILTLFAGFEAKFFVCVSCQNVNCPLYKGKK
jgi:hypothetical protein